MTSIAVVGAGPGGLMTAYLLEKKYGSACCTTVFESSGRSGGKIQTRTFSAAPVLYEAGVAECYDYSHLGPDPLRNLVTELGLETVPVSGNTVVLDGHVLSCDNHIRHLWGDRTMQAIQELRRRAAAMMPLKTWQESRWEDDNSHPWSGRTCEEILDEVEDPVARRYLRICVHSDLATEPHLTNGLNGLKNFVMDVPGYVGQYAIAGGMEMLPRGLEQSLTRTTIELNSCVERVMKNSDGSYSLVIRRGSGTVSQDEFDAIYLALPHNYLCTIRFESERLRRAMASHVARYDHPGHYLRVSVLFRRSFWRDRINGSWFMVDAFGGCCVYDETSRYPGGDYGVLGWLLAGSDALLHGNLEDGRLTDRVLESLPEPLRREARESFVEAKVHRWGAAVSGQPGGLPLRDPRLAHRPEPQENPQVFVVGDYLFDSTLNGVLDSANIATDLLNADLWTRRTPWLQPPSVQPPVERAL